MRAGDEAIVVEARVGHAQDLGRHAVLHGERGHVVVPTLDEALHERAIVRERASRLGGDRRELVHVAREAEEAHLGAEERPRPRLHALRRLVDEDVVEDLRVEGGSGARRDGRAHDPPRGVVALHGGPGGHALRREHERRLGVAEARAEAAHVKVGGADVGRRAEEDARVGRERARALDEARGLPVPGGPWRISRASDDALGSHSGDARSGCGRTRPSADRLRWCGSGCSK